MSAGAQKTRLGRGLASLIGDRYEEGALLDAQRIVPLAALKPGRFNPRRTFAEAQLEELVRRDPSLATAFSADAQSGDEALVRLLRDRGADASRSAADGTRPVDLAANDAIRRLLAG